MNKTANYQLNQWEPSDKVQHGDFNADNAKIDAALKAQADALAGKAAASTVSSLQSSVSSLSSSLSRKGNCQLYFSTYTGNGQFNYQNPSTLTFPKRPLFVLIANAKHQLFLVQGVTGSWADAFGGSGGSVSVSWSGNSVSWYSSYVAGQMNESGMSYAVIALFQTD